MNHVTAHRSFFPHDAAELARQVEAGEVRSVARVISLLENRDPLGAAVLTHVAPSLNRALVIGITGYPGTGKSTVIDQLITAYRRLGEKVGVLAVDISSPVTGGAVLGDRIRMQRHTDDAQVYIRSMATRGHQGGLAAATRQAVRVLDAAGFGVILIETVGVGQSDVDIMQVAHTVVAVVAPGLGDDVQAMKAGLLEVADIVVVNKGDREGADAALRDLREWCKTVIRTVAVKGEGIAELIAVIAEHERWRDLDSPELHKRRGLFIDRGSRAG
ncbi:MAG: methylmalonyl Co-A mutase-associated GTPase MeaB [Nitrospiraceae bacterium]|nr:methylmalonyl Co-A mutase-associated GTPase MeaB [Nitrospiraceae bacterium]